MLTIKIIVERNDDGYTAYPLGVKGVIVGEGDTYEIALRDVESALTTHVEVFGEVVLELIPTVHEAFIPKYQLT